MELEKLRDIIEDVLHIDKRQITEETTFIEDLSADSLDMFEIAVEVGRTFEIEISAEEGAELVSVGDVLKLIRSSRAGY